MSQPLRRSPAIALVACIASLALLAGCGGSESQTSAEREPSAGKPKLNAEVCDRLAPLVASRISAAGGTAESLGARSSGTASLSTCAFATSEASVSVSLDTATDSHQRFSNRTVEQIQFSEGDPARVPKVVRGVGDPQSENSGAVWTTARAQLLAIRGDRLLIVGFYVKGAPDRVLSAAAAAIGRRAYVITPSSTS